MLWNILLWASILWLPALLYFMLKNEAKFKKNLAVGVTLPHAAREDPEVLALLERFRRQTGWVCLGLTAVAVPCLWIRGMGLSLAVWCVWLLLAMALPYLPYIACHRALTALKVRRGWQPARPETAAELTVAAEPQRWLSPLWFLLPLAVSLLPLALDRTQWILYLTDAAMVGLFWLCYRYCYRSKAEAVDENTALTRALTRLRRYNWGKCWVWCAWLMAGLNLCVWLLRRHPLAMLAAVLALSAAICAVVIGVEFRTRQAQERLTAASGVDYYVDEDDKWIWGLVYYAPNDQRLMVNKRVGMGTTMNMARRPAQVLMAAMLLLLLAMPLLGVWISSEERAVVTLEVSGATLTAAHAGTHYTIPLDEVESAELLEQMPDIQRVWGSGLDTVQKGSYASRWGNITVCLDPRAGPWLLVTTADGEIYLLGAADSTQTRAVYAALAG